MEFKKHVKNMKMLEILSQESILNKHTHDK